MMLTSRFLQSVQHNSYCCIDCFWGNLFVHFLQNLSSSLYRYPPAVLKEGFAFFVPYGPTRKRLFRHTAKGLGPFWRKSPESSIKTSGISNRNLWTLRQIPLNFTAETFELYGKKCGTFMRKPPMFSVRPFLIRIRRLVITKQFVPANIPGMSLTRSLSGTLKIIDVFALGGGRICPSAVSFGKILHSRECFLPSREASCKPFCTEIFSGCRIILHLFRHSARYSTHGNSQCVLAISSGSVGCVGENHEKKYRERK